MKNRTCEFCGATIGSVSELASGHCNVLSKRPDPCTLRAIREAIRVYGDLDPEQVPAELRTAVVRLSDRLWYLLETTR